MTAVYFSAHDKIEPVLHCRFNIQTCLVTKVLRACYFNLLKNLSRSETVPENV